MKANKTRSPNLRWTEVLTAKKRKENNLNAIFRMKVCRINKFFCWNCFSLYTKCMVRFSENLLLSSAERCDNKNQDETKQILIWFSIFIVFILLNFFKVQVHPPVKCHPPKIELVRVCPATSRPQGYQQLLPKGANIQSCETQMSPHQQQLAGPGESARGSPSPAPCPAPYFKGGSSF